MKTDRQGIEQIYGEYSRSLYLASLRILGNSQEAEDVMQDTILKVCSDLSSRIENIGAYLMRSCINKSLDVVRKRKRYQTYQSEIKADEDVSFSPDYSEGSQTDITSKVIAMISRLPKSCRQIVSLKLIEGYDYEEIAEITSMKENSIRSNYMRGRQRLASMLKKEGLYERF